MKQLILFLILLFSANLSFCQGKDLPLILEKSDSTKYLIFHITGDGGWRGFDIELAKEYKAHQMSYIILNAQKYFWSAKTPDALTNDISPVLEDYLKKWDKKELLLVGFSFGAEIMPFLYNSLPQNLKIRVKCLILITPAASSDFTIHLTDMIGVNHHYSYDVVKEVEKIKIPEILTIFGEKEDSTFPENHEQDNFKIEYTKGGHHFTDSRSVMELILKVLK
jgi:type IV secretory pathway VirJ component